MPSRKSAEEREGGKIVKNRFGITWGTGEALGIDAKWAARCEEHGEFKTNTARRRVRHLTPAEVCASCLANGAPIVEQKARTPRKARAKSSTTRDSDSIIQVIGVDDDTASRLENALLQKTMRELETAIEDSASLHDLAQPKCVDCGERWDSTGEGPFRMRRCPECRGENS
jgi:hypothetical protein